MHFSGHFSALQEKYYPLLQERISPLKEILLELEGDNQPRSPHPKMAELVKTVSSWKRDVRKSSRDKVREGEWGGKGGGRGREGRKEREGGRKGVATTT